MSSTDPAGAHPAALELQAVWTVRPGVDVPFRSDCLTRPVLDQIADKWSLMVMATLEEPRRFNEIKRRLEGITQRVLTQTLRRLERSGMVVRTVLPTSPVGVEYSLTPMGHSLREPFGHLYAWTVAHAEQIHANQTAYDHRQASISE